MRKLFVAVVQILVLAGGSGLWAADDSLERLLRAQAFNREFEGFDSYYVKIEADQPQPDAYESAVSHRRWSHCRWPGVGRHRSSSVPGTGASSVLISLT